MMGGKCKCMRLCPFSFGLAWGITYALTILVITVAIMHGEAPPGMPFFKGEVLTWYLVWKHTLIALVEGFIYGLIFAFIYDGILRLGRCGKGSGEGCGCESTDKIDKMTR